MTQRFKIDLTKIEGEGEFLCPVCQELISPDDQTGLTYDIVETATNEDGDMQAVTIQCRKCRSIIQLVGFEALTETGDLDYLDDYLGFKANIGHTE